MAKRLGRSRTWLAKWRARFGEQGTTGLRSHSRQPRTQPRAWASGMVRLIVQTRKRLRKAPAGLIGARAIRHELKQLMPRRPLPWAATIYRALQRAGLSAHLSPSSAAYFPAPADEVAGSVDALDWTCRYLEGGTQVYAFRTLNLRTRALHQTLARNKELGTAQEHVLAAWKIRGIPQRLVGWPGLWGAPSLRGLWPRLSSECPLPRMAHPPLPPARAERRNSGAEAAHRAPTPAHPAPAARPPSHLADYGGACALHSSRATRRYDSHPERTVARAQVAGGPLCLGHHYDTSPHARHLVAT
ncbi:MAG: hypothetical protein AB1671_18330 [Thermodesulfobacteriota bacterium]